MRLYVLVLSATSLFLLLQAASPAAEAASVVSAAAAEADSAVSAPASKTAETIPSNEQSSGNSGGSPAGTSSLPPDNSAIQHKSSGLLNPVAPQGILSTSQGHEKHGLISRALGGVVADAAHATMALVGSTILNQGIDLPPDDAGSPEWPFNEPHRKALYTVNWADGSSAKISRLPDGSLQILGSGRRYIMQPESGGSYALLGDYGSMATVTPRLDGGYTILKADGSAEQILPRQGGGYVVEDARGVVATILPGVGGKHMIRGNSCSSGFIY